MLASCHSRNFALQKDNGPFIVGTPQSRAQTRRPGNGTFPDVAADVIPLGRGSK